VYATEAQPKRRASPGICCGGTWRTFTSGFTFSGFSCEISQFWQLMQCRLQPTVAREKIFEPGRK
jgi:hypothetical protein